MVPGSKFQVLGPTFQARQLTQFPGPKCDPGREYLELGTWNLELERYMFMDCYPRL